MASSSKVDFSSVYEQPILFKYNEEIEEILHTNEHKRTMFLAWFKGNKIYPKGKIFTYSEYFSHFVWMEEEREWKQRKTCVSIGRLTYIPSGSGELYYLRLLLNF